jgi:hypothetical protein
MQRTLQPELLDSLPPDHPDALHNRRDLRLTNAITGTHRWIARTVPTLLQPGERALELGAGTGELGRKLAAAGLACDGLDLWPRPDDWPSACGWHREDLMRFTGFEHYTVVFANFLLHQFSDADLARLGTRLRHANVRAIVACEPVRCRRSQVLFRVLGPVLGANHVSLHDAHVSIAAGFRGEELPRTLGLPPTEWRVRCNSTWLGIYRLVAQRRT